MDIRRALRLALLVLSIEQVIAISAILFVGWQNHQAGLELSQRSDAIKARIKVAQGSLSRQGAAAERQAEVAAIDNDHQIIVAEQALLARRERNRVWLMGLQALIGLVLVGIATAGFYYRDKSPDRL